MVKQVVSGTNRLFEVWGGKRCLFDCMCTNRLFVVRQVVRGTNRLFVVI